MTRVSSFGHNQSLINNLLANQAKLVKAEQQISDGKKATAYSGLGRDISSLLSAKTVKAQTDNNLETTNSVLDKLAFNELYLTNMHDQTESLRSALLDGFSAEEFSAFDEVLEQTFNTVVNSLNAQLGGVYLFGGTRSDAEPITVDTIANLVALPTVADAFQNSNIKPKARVDAGVTVEFGMLAEDVGTEVMASLKRIAEYHAGAFGPLDGPITPAQRTFLEGELTNLEATLRDITGSQVENGIRTNKMEELRDRHEVANVVLAQFISNIEDVDITEAVTRMQQNQLALQASLSVLGQLSQLTLLDYI